LNKLALTVQAKLYYVVMSAYYNITSIIVCTRSAFFYHKVEIGYEGCLLISFVSLILGILKSI